jgi:superfamily I DNA/RNA helicase
VLCRYRTQQLLVALALDAGEIPRTPALGATLFTHPAATLLRAYLNLVRAPEALPGPALAALLNRPNRYLSSRVVEAAGAASRPWAHVRKAAAGEPAVGPRPLSTLVELVAAAREQIAAAGHTSSAGHAPGAEHASSAGQASSAAGGPSSEDLVWTVVETFGLDDLWAAEADAAAAGTPSDGAGPLDVFDSLLLLAETYPDPDLYLRTWDRLRADEEAHVGVADDTLAREESEEDRVVIVTIHAAKGREYHSVVVPDYDCDVSRWGPAEVEEERRVVYVGVTRARDAVLFTVDTSTGFVHPFLRELVEPPEPGEHEALSAWFEEKAGQPDDGLRALIADRLAEIAVLFPELVPEPATELRPVVAEASSPCSSESSAPARPAGDATSATAAATAAARRSASPSAACPASGTAAGPPAARSR